MIRAEYLRFLQTLNDDAVPAGERKIANLVLQHLDELIPLSTAQGQRTKKMVLLAQENWNTISAEIQSDLEQTTEQAAPVTRALLGAMLCDLARDEITAKLKKSLNPLTSYTIPGVSEILSSAPEWSIKFK
ncbi:MAG TPA: hypothetical protein ENJ30_12060 [Desulfobulbaceae bacterium]|nr:hypothetical protein [Desulfobulbaceae bacterium]